MQRKPCSRCHTVKLLSEFSRCRRDGSGHKSECKVCQSVENKLYRAKYPERVRITEQRANLKQWYGMTLAEYDTLFERQQGRCAICQQPEPVKDGGIVKRLHVDHDHTTGKVRGLLCQCCNMGLGNFKDQANLLESAAHYLLNRGDSWETPT